jgi:hypothetical protein
MSDRQLPSPLFALGPKGSPGEKGMLIQLWQFYSHIQPPKLCLKLFEQMFCTFSARVSGSYCAQISSKVVFHIKVFLNHAIWNCVMIYILIYVNILAVVKQLMYPSFLRPGHCHFVPLNCHGNSLHLLCPVHLPSAWRCISLAAPDPKGQRSPVNCTRRIWLHVFSNYIDQNVNQREVLYCHVGSNSWTLEQSISPRAAA